jgi:hypothetical protein
LDGIEQRTYVNQEMGTFYRSLYPGMVTTGGQRVAAWSWTHWGLKPYVDQGTFLGKSMAYPVLRKQKRSLHTCAQDVQITRTTTI